MPNRKTAHKPATWGQRFWAWLIDIVIVGSVTGIMYSSFGPGGSLIPFLYWTLLEGSNGQSVGKIALGLKVVRASGKKINFLDAAVQSFGKAFLLPVDLVVGWILFPKTRQRLFNKVSDTVVVKMK